MKPELFSISVILQPLEEAVITTGHGYQTNALLLKLLNMSSPIVAEEVHDINGPKPFTISLLQGIFGRMKAGLLIKPGNQYTFRITFLKSDIFAHFLDAVIQWGRNPVQIGPANLQIIKVDTLPNSPSTACFSSFQELYENASVNSRIKLEFQSPTTFRSAGKRNVLFPEPVTIFTGYLLKWQSFSQISLPASINDWLAKAVIGRFNLKTRVLDFNTYQETGVTGRIYLTLAEDTPEDIRRWINALADFAYYCGTGAKTTMGMGQTRRMPLKDKIL